MRQKTNLPSDTARANLVVNSVALEFGLDLNNVTHPSGRGSPHIVLARQIAMYLFHTVYNVNLTRVAHEFRRHRSTAKHACSIVEQSREDPVLDGRIQQLEAFLKRAPVPMECRA